MSLNMKNSVLLAKLEPTPGVDAAPTGALNAILCRNMSVNPLEQDIAQRDLVVPYFGNDEQIPTTTRMSISFEVEMAGSGVPGTAPAWGPLHRACGMKETVVAATEVNYTPKSKDFEAMTIVYNLDGVQHKMIGARGTVSARQDSRGIPVWAYTFTGLYVDVVDATVLSVDYSKFLKPLAVNERNTPQLILHGQSVVTESSSFDVGNTVVYRNLINFEGVDITDRETKGQIVFQATKVATYDWFAAVKNANTGNFSVVHGLTAGNIVEINAGKVQIVNPRITDSDNKAMMNLDMNFIPTSAGNDEFEIVSR